MKRWFLELVSDDQGRPSSMRLMMLLFAVCILGAWLYSVIWQAWVNPPWEPVAALAAGKAAQKFGEK